jgi:hypothetical protein
MCSTAGQGSRLNTGDDAHALGATFGYHTIIILNTLRSPKKGVDPMPHARFTVHETVERGKELYEREIRPNVEEGNTGKTVVIDIETGEYEIDDDPMAATHRALAKHPDAALYRTRIGFPAFGKIGGSWGNARR